MSVITPLYDHTNFESSYMVESYPYGRLRCNMHYWLESNNKGVRLAMQSRNPKTGLLNTPKYGTYAKISANLYLDENAHCQYSTVTEYTSAEEVYTFIKNFPNNHRMRDLTEWCKLKYAYDRRCVEHELGHKNRNPDSFSVRNEQDLEKHTNAMRLWLRCFNLTQQQAEDKEYG